ncbi:MAG: hypothetical protein ACF8Q5_02215 [Phycisphaerales bacterium JB040]
MRRWLRQHGLVELAHPVRVQRAAVWKRKRRQRARTGLGKRPCWRCGYELLGLPEPICPECGTAHDPSWYRGRFRAGGVWRQVVFALLLGVASPGITLGFSAAMTGYGASAVLGASLTPRLWLGSVLGGVAIAVTLTGFVVGWRTGRRLLWGPVRHVRLAVEASCVCALLGVLAWSVVLNELFRLAM